MRDAHRIREKFELSLDGRQIGSLLIGAIIVLGAVFVVGVVVGKKLAASKSPKPSLDVLTTLDRRAEALQKDRQAQLTFQKVLTQPSPKPAPALDPVTAEPHASSKKVAEPAGEETKATQAEAEVHTTAPAPPKPVAPVQQAPKETLQAAFAKIEPAAAPIVASTSKAQGAYTIQVLSSQDRDESARRAKDLRGRGYRTSVVEANLGAKGTWYRVYVGQFETRDQASRYLKDLERELHLDGFIVKR